MVFLGGVLINQYFVIRLGGAHFSILLPPRLGAKATTRNNVKSCILLRRCSFLNIIYFLFGAENHNTKITCKLLFRLGEVYSLILPIFFVFLLLSFTSITSTFPSSLLSISAIDFSFNSFML